MEKRHKIVCPKCGGGQLQIEKKWSDGSYDNFVIDSLFAHPEDGSPIVDNKAVVSEDEDYVEDDDGMGMDAYWDGEHGEPTDTITCVQCHAEFSDVAEAIK